MMMAVAYNDSRQLQQPMMMAVVAYDDKGDNDLQQWQTTAAGPKPRRGGGGRCKGRRANAQAGEGNRSCVINKGQPMCKRGGLHHNGQNDVYSHVETSGERWDAFFGFSRPTLR